MIWRQAGKNVDVIGDTAIDMGMAVHPANDAAEVGVKFGKEFGVKPRFTVFRAEYEVVMEGMMGRWHVERFWRTCRCAIYFGMGFQKFRSLRLASHLATFGARLPPLASVKNRSGLSQTYARDILNLYVNVLTCRINHDG